MSWPGLALKEQNDAGGLSCEGQKLSLPLRLGTCLGFVQLGRRLAPRELGEVSHSSHLGCSLPRAVLRPVEALPCLLLIATLVCYYLEHHSAGGETEAQGKEVVLGGSKPRSRGLNHHVPSKQLSKASADPHCPKCDPGPAALSIIRNTGSQAPPWPTGSESAF